MIARMNYSLATLVLAVLWIGAGMAIYARRAPWVEGDTIRTVENPQFREYMGDRAPDGRRTVNYDGDTSISDKQVLWTFDYFNGEPQMAERFADDDTLELWRKIPSSSPPNRWALVRFHRRFPEWWWGHFYRPEVWLFMGLSGALLWRFVQRRRNLAERQKTSPGF